MEKSETASRGGRIISNKIKLENLMRIVRLVAAIFQIAIIVIAFMSKQVIVINITDLKGYTPDYIQWYFYEYTGVQNESGLIQLVEVIKVVSTVLLWMTADNAGFFISGFFTAEDLIRLAESVCEK